MRTPQNQTKRLTRKEKYAIQRQTKKVTFGKMNFKNVGLSIFFFSGLILTIFEINIFHKTIVDWKIPTSIWFFGGLLFAPFMSKHLVNYYNTTGLFLQSVFNICSFGGILVYVFMATNYYLGVDNQSETIRTEILKTGHLAKGRNGCGNPYADVKIKNSDKELIFPCNFEIERYKYVDLILKKGLLGFDIILAQIPRTK